MTINAFPIPTINAAEFNPQSYGWLPDGINHSTEMQALLNAVVAAGGGTIRFPAAAGRYRCDAQLFIPNDATATPNQVNIRIVGSGGGPIWDNNARTTVNAVVLDLRYTASDGNAKIETRGYGGLVIENLTLIDGGTANNTPFIHTSSTTLVFRG